MRRGMTVFALLAATALTAAGCATDEQTVESGSAAPDRKSEQPAEKLSPFEQRAAEILKKWPKEVEPAEGTGDDLLPLEGAELPDPDATSIKLTVGHGSCDEDFGAHLQETGKVIIVSGWAKEDPKADFCTEQLVTDEVTVNLKEKFGDRTLIDAATGRPVKTVEADKGDKS